MTGFLFGTVFGLLLGWFFLPQPETLAAVTQKVKDFFAGFFD